MPKYVQGLVLIGLLVVSLQPVNAQTLLSSQVSRNDSEAEFINRPAPPTPSQIIESFISAEAKVREALNHYTFKREVVLQTIGVNGEVTGEYIRHSHFVFDDKGNRIERVVYRPESTLKGMKITQEDIQDLQGAQLLGIDITETSKYRLEYAGTENEGTHTLHVLKVTPLQTPNPNRMRERFFVGRIWLDPITFQIIKVHGKVEPQGKQRFPVFQTRREPIGDLFFPTLSEADDILHFQKSDVHYRVKVRCYDYKRFASTVKLIEIDPSDE